MKDVAAAFEAHRGFLWGLCYRMTSDASTAEDLVQETFVRALERPPEPGALRPWLTKVAMHLSVDALRKRRRTAYVGAWLPTPVELDAREEDEDAGASQSAPSPSARYDLMESATLAFLVALEVLSPLQRGVLLLRDVFDHSVQEAAQALSLSESHVKVTHHRARKAVAASGYDGERMVPTPEVQARHQAALEAFLGAVLGGDVAQVEALLTQEVRAVSDGGGRYAAAKVPIIGAAKVARLYLKLAQRPLAGHAELRVVNGLPAVLLVLEAPPGKNSPVTLLQPLVGDDGRIRRIFSVVIPEKLSRLWKREAFAPGAATGHPERAASGVSS